MESEKMVEPRAPFHILGAQKFPLKIFSGNR